MRRSVVATCAGIALVAGAAGFALGRGDHDDVEPRPVVAVTSTTTTTRPPSTTIAPTTTTMAPATTTTSAPVTTTALPPVVVVTPVCDIHAPYNDPVNAHCWMTEEEFIDARLAELIVGPS